MGGGTRRLVQVMKGKRAGRARQMCNFLCFLFRTEDRLLFLFPLFSSPLSGGLWGEGERGALLGSIVSIWDRNWSCNNPPFP